MNSKDVPVTTRHTRGPWRINGAELIGDSTVLATLHWHSGRQIQNDADAALIAAAPDLLAALKRMLSFMVLDDVDLHPAGCGCDVHQALAAIAKAEGVNGRQ